MFKPDRTPSAGWLENAKNTLGDYFELMRLPNVFTALADAAMGYLFVRELVAPGDAWLLFLLLASSSLLYIGGVVFNDVFDRELDARERPDRPLPSGRISPRAAIGFGGAMLVAGAVFGWVAAFLINNIVTGAIVIILVASILIYDAGLKSTLIGPVLMGACRMFNVLLGMSAASAPFTAEHWVVAGAIGLYIAGVTWFSRTENTRSARIALAGATITMILSIALLGTLPLFSERLVPLLQEEPQRWYLLMLFLGILIGWRCLRAVLSPTPAQVQAAVAQGILSLIILDAAVCFAVQGLFWAVMILLLLLPAMLLGKWIELT